jgi:hypothetical protein
VFTRDCVKISGPRSRGRLQRSPTTTPARGGTVAPHTRRRKLEICGDRRFGVLVSFRDGVRPNKGAKTRKGAYCGTVLAFKNTD